MEAYTTSTGQQHPIANVMLQISPLEWEKVSNRKKKSIEGLNVKVNITPLYVAINGFWDDIELAHHILTQGEEPAPTLNTTDTTSLQDLTVKREAIDLPESSSDTKSSTTHESEVYVPDYIEKMEWLWIMEKYGRNFRKLERDFHVEIGGVEIEADIFQFKVTSTNQSADHKQVLDEIKDIIELSTAKGPVLKKTVPTGMTIKSDELLHGSFLHVDRSGKKFVITKDSQVLDELLTLQSHNCPTSAAIQLSQKANSDEMAPEQNNMIHFPETNTRHPEQKLSVHNATVKDKDCEGDLPSGPKLKPEEKEVMERFEWIWFKAKYGRNMKQLEDKYQIKIQHEKAKSGGYEIGVICISHGADSIAAWKELKEIIDLSLTKGPVMYRVVPRNMDVTKSDIPAGTFIHKDEEDQLIVVTKNRHGLDFLNQQQSDDLEKQPENDKELHKDQPNDSSTARSKRLLGNGSMEKAKKDQLSNPEGRYQSDIIKYIDEFEWFWVTQRYHSQFQKIQDTYNVTINSKEIEPYFFQIILTAADNFFDFKPVWGAIEDILKASEAIGPISSKCVPLKMQVELSKLPHGTYVYTDSTNNRYLVAKDAKQLNQILQQADKASGEHDNSSLRSEQQMTGVANSFPHPITESTTKQNTTQPIVTQPCSTTHEPMDVDPDCFTNQGGARPKLKLQNYTDYNYISSNSYTPQVHLNGLLMHFLNKDITMIKADCLVCICSSVEMDHEHGIAWAISKAAGARLSAECREHVQKHGPLHGMRTYVSKGYNLPCDSILHIYGPQYHGTSSEKDLVDIIQHCLATSTAQKFRSLAMPLIGSGAAGFPIESVISSYKTAIENFQECNHAASNLAELYLVSLDATMITCLHSSFSSNIGLETIETKPDHFSVAQIMNEDMALSRFDNLQLITNLDDDSENPSANCSICMDTLNKKTKKLDCGHIFCKSCIEKWFKENPSCPQCGKIFGTRKGNQPSGKMHHKKRSFKLPGHEHDSKGTIEIAYVIKSGKQTEKHPNPGKPFTGTTRTAYLPDSEEGNKVLNLLKKAFDAKLIFTIGQSSTTGETDTVIWNDIHHKTKMTGGASSHGYPDPTYLMRVQEELTSKGIK